MKNLLPDALEEGSTHSSNEKSEESSNHSGESDQGPQEQF
jgi:hypothetical protein